MGLQDIILLAVCFLGFAAIGLAILKITSGVKERPEPPLRNEAAVAAGNNEAVNPAVRRRNRPRNEGADGGEEEEEDGDDEPDFSNMSKKDILKHEKRRAKAAAREQEEALREQRREKEEKRMEALRERELEREREFELKQQELERLRKIEEKRLADSYNAWKDPVSVETSDRGEFFSLLSNYLVENQITSMDAIAKKFDLSPYACVKNVEKLIDSQQLIGSITADGHVVCLSGASRRTCAQFLQSQGRVDRNDIYAEFNRSVSAH